MNLYLISQELCRDYDTYDSAVVAAENEQAARETHPCDMVTHHKNGKWMGTYGANNDGSEYENNDGRNWPRFEKINAVKVEYLGKTTKPAGVILASFNAG